MLPTYVVSEDPLRPAMRNAVRIGPSSRIITTTIKLPTTSLKPTFPIIVMISTMTIAPKRVATTNSTGKISTPVKNVCKMTFLESVLKLRLSEKIEATARRKSPTCCPKERFIKKRPSLWKALPQVVSFSCSLVCSSSIVIANMHAVNCV